MLDLAARRQAFRAILTGADCVQLASVFDPISARLAQSAGFRGAFLSGSVAAGLVHGAPDVGLLTLSELTEQIRRVVRASDIPLLADGDHGYGNALNTIWAVREIEAAGAAGISIEDLVLPQPYGTSGDRVIPEEEFAAKLRAAVAARSSADFVIVGQTIVAPEGDVAALVSRVRLIEAAGADAALIYKLPDQAGLEAIAATARIPLILAPIAPELNRPELLRRHGVKASFLGHQAFRASIAAQHQAYLALIEDNAPARAATLGATSELLQSVLKRDQIAALMQEYMNSELE